MRFFLKCKYANWDNKKKWLFNSLISILMWCLMVLIYFSIAFFIEPSLKLRKMDNLSYISILFTWTLLFTLYFYISYNKYLDTYNREIHIYLLLLSIYIIALLIKHNLLSSVISLYQPYNDYWENINIQYCLQNYLIKYSEYIIEWSLIQGVILAILIYFNFGKKMQEKYIKRRKEDQLKYQSLNKIINIIEEIYKNPELKEYCIDFSKNIKEENYKYIDNLVKYNKIITSIRKDTEEEYLILFLKKFNLYFLANEQLISVC